MGLVLDILEDNADILVILDDLLQLFLAFFFVDKHVFSGLLRLINAS